MVDWVSAIVRIGSNALAPRNKCVLDNICFQLHYKVTTAFLMCCVMVLTGSLWVGKPISCIVNDSSLKEMFENHCLLTGTTTIYRTSYNPDKAVYRVHSPYPGILPQGVLRDGHHEEKRHPWYKWTALILFALAGAFYIPRMLWKLAEGGRLNALRQDLGGRRLLTPEERDQQRKLAVDCLLQSRGRSNRFYCLSFFSLEVLNIAISGGVLYLLNVIFDNQYVRFGLLNFDFLFLNQSIARYDPMDRLFPKVATCKMEFYGSGGGITKVSGLCFLYHNYLNELIFLVLWYWLVIVVIITAYYVFPLRALCFTATVRQILLHNKCAASKQTDIDTITNELGFCDWFLLNYLLAEISSPYMAHGVIRDLAAEIRKQSPHIEEPS